MEGKPKKKWKKAAIKKHEQPKAEQAKELGGEHKGHSRVKAMYGDKKGKYYHG